jgi:hypothetical protein
MVPRWVRKVIRETTSVEETAPMDLVVNCHGLDGMGCIRDVAP